MSNSRFVRDYKLNKDDLKLIKPGDVFRFMYHHEIAKRKTDIWWAFDGKLVVCKDKEGIHLQDTFWGFCSGEGKRFNLDNVLELGTLTFICNLNDVKLIDPHDSKYYDDNDLYDLSYHHGYQTKICVRKDASKSHAKMMETIDNEIEKTESEINSLLCKLKKLKEIRAEATTEVRKI